jgi:hypothetical protein
LDLKTGQPFGDQGDDIQNKGLSRLKVGAFSPERSYFPEPFSPGWESGIGQAWPLALPLRESAARDDHFQ